MAVPKVFFLVALQWIVNIQFSNSAIQHRTTQDGFDYVNFVAHQTSRLFLPPGFANTLQKSQLIYDDTDCMSACLDEPWCHSMNLKISPEKNGRHVCELMSTDMYNNSKHFIPDKRFIHFSIKSPCENRPCSKNGRCIALYNKHDYYCACATGFSGRTCLKDVNECGGSHGCHVNGKCFNTPGSYICRCNSGYHGNGTQCTDVNECGGSHGCHVNAKCINTPGSYICRCKSGYHGNGTQCTDVNECGGSHGCHVNAKCINTPGSYICRCNSGYHGNGTQCTATGVRLSHGSYGRVEVSYGGQWGTVCDDGWHMNDGHVVCRMLGYNNATSAPTSATYGQGTGQIWLDNVNCSGNETSIFSCPHGGIASHDCNHGEDASVVCA